MNEAQKGFEAWLESEFGMWAIQPEPGVYGSEKIQNMWKAWQAAMQSSQTAPAVPEIQYRGAIQSAIKMLRERFEGKRCDSDGVSGCIHCNIMFLCTQLEKLLAAAPQPDHSPDAGKVAPQVMGRVAHLDDGSVICHLNSVGRTLPDHTALYDHPAESREEIMAQALEQAFEQLADEYAPYGLLYSYTAFDVAQHIRTQGKHYAARLRASQQEGGNQ